MNVKKNPYVLDGLCSWAVVELAENPTIGTDMSCVSWHTFPFPPPEFLTNCCPAKEILLDDVKELLLGAGGRGEEVFYFNLCQLLNIFIQACAHATCTSIR